MRREREEIRREEKEWGWKARKLTRREGIENEGMLRGRKRRQKKRREEKGSEEKEREEREGKRRDWKGRREVKPGKGGEGNISTKR